MYAHNDTAKINKIILKADAESVKNITQKVHLWISEPTSKKTLQIKVLHRIGLMPNFAKEITS